ncbi:hypothetical protein FOT80_29430 [Serratia fonticola]|nr:hypothetical protein [Serratia fonticola]
MKKSLIGRCIRRWRVALKPWCDSKVNPYWQKRDLGKFCRETGRLTAAVMVHDMAQRNAQVDYGVVGWSPEFAAWYDGQRAQYEKEARDYLNEEAGLSEIDEYVEAEIDAWSC